MSATLEIQHAIAMLELIEQQLAELASEGLATPLEKVLAGAIPAQLELLRLAVEYGNLPAGSGSRFIMAALTLARAINGKDTK